MPRVARFSLVSHSATRFRRAERSDLEAIASWLHSADDCRLWSGSRVAFPVDVPGLAAAIEFDTCESRCLVEEGRVIAFGQLVPKAKGRFHVARILVARERRREGLGRSMTSRLIEVALEHNADAISLNVARDNPGATQLYTSLGFSEAPRPEDEVNSPALYMLRRAGR